MSNDLLLKAIKAERARRSLAFFVEETSGYKLHPWQLLLCERLQRLKDEKGQRILIHAPPQVGKSQIVSKRLPLWLVLNDPTCRVALACYNKTKASQFAWVNKLVAESPEFKAWYPDFAWAKWADDTGGYTHERLRYPDAQPSIASFGLDSGFTGSGCEHLFLDDPYANASQARSAAYSESVRSFWEETAEPRVMKDNSNVVVMFHRYHEADIAGYLMTKGDWELLTFPAIANGSPSDPTGREVGEVLSPFHSLEQLRKKEADDPKTFAGQFQGDPLADGERPIATDNITVLPAHKCPDLVGWWRGFDTAYTTKTGSDHSATLRVAFDPYGNLHLRGFRKDRIPLAQITDWAADIAKKDPPKTFQAIEMHNAGFAVSDYLKRIPGISPWVVNQRVTGQEGKLRVRLIEFIHLVASPGRVYVYEEGDYQKFMDECETFTGLIDGESDDLLAALAVILLAIKGQKSKHEERPNINIPIKKPSKLFAGQS